MTGTPWLNELLIPVRSGRSSGLLPVAACLDALAAPPAGWLESDRVDSPERRIFFFPMTDEDIRHSPADFRRPYDEEAELRDVWNYSLLRPLRGAQAADPVVRELLEFLSQIGTREDVSRELIPRILHRCSAHAVHSSDASLLAATSHAASWFARLETNPWVTTSTALCACISSHPIRDRETFWDNFEKIVIALQLNQTLLPTLRWQVQLKTDFAYACWFFMNGQRQAWHAFGTAGAYGALAHVTARYDERITRDQNLHMQLLSIRRSYQAVRRDPELPTGPPPLSATAKRVSALLMDEVRRIP